MNNVPESNEPESFIVQNVTLGPHYVSDIKLNFSPLQAIDLTWMDPAHVKNSKDLRQSLRMGLLKKITLEQFDQIEERQAIREKKELLKQQNNMKLQDVEVDGRQMQAETIDAEKAYNPDGTVSTAGYANDSLSYAMALDIAQQQAQLRGDDLSVEDFAEQVQKDPSLVGRMINMQKNMEANSSVSGTTRKAQAYVATSNENSNGTSVQKMRMTNINRDGYIAGGDFDYAAVDEGPIAEAIDLEAIDSDSDKGSFRRV
jgi:hypothetical protein